LLLLKHLAAVMTEAYSQIVRKRFDMDVLTWLVDEALWTLLEIFDNIAILLYINLGRTSETNSLLHHFS
jgi:hypothetical protein